jgi:predicted  nucleic acid-binding Zn-ribbon protein
LLDQLRYLVQLQHLQNKKALLIRSRDETPKCIAEIEKEYQQVEAEFLVKKAELEHAQKMHRSLEQAVADLETKIGRSKQRMNEVKTNKEYQAMLKEIEDLKKDINQKEDRMLEAMESIESSSQELKRQEKQLQERKKKMEADKQELTKQSERVKEQLESLEALQEKVREKLEAGLLKRCESLLHRHGGIAVAAVEAGVCQVCHMNIPPQKFIELQRDENICNCPHCHRFIYWPGHENYQIFEEEVEEV